MTGVQSETDRTGTTATRTAEPVVKDLDIEPSNDPIPFDNTLPPSVPRSAAEAYHAVAGTSETCAAVIHLYIL